MEGDASLKYYAASGEGSFFSLRGKKQIPANLWTHVCLVQDEAQCRLYVNGALDAEGTMDSHMLKVCEVSKLVFNVESLHPYRDNSNDYTIMEVFVHILSRDSTFISIHRSVSVLSKTFLFPLVRFQVL